MFKCHMVIRAFAAADYAAISEIASNARPDTSWTAAQLHEADRTRARHLEFGGFLAEVDGRAVGFVRYTQYADYFQPEKVVLFGAVLLDDRGQGIGGRLLEALEQHLPTLGVFQMQAQASEADAATLNFLRRRGFAQTWRRLEYRLDVREVDTRSLEALASKLKEQNIEVKAYPALAADSNRDEKLRALSWRLEQDVPYGEPLVELGLEAFLRERLEPKAVLRDAFYIALAGETFIGMSSLWSYGTYLETEFTGVLPDYRGRGVGTLLKLLGLNYAKRHGFPEIRTTNDAGNSAMRTLNEHLGFRAQPALLRLEKQLSQSAMLRL